jgi:hypothetical protein
MIPRYAGKKLEPLYKKQLESKPLLEVFARLASKVANAKLRS